MSRTCKLGALIAAVAFCAAAHGQSVRGLTADKILIGQSVPLSGANAGLGSDIREGLLAYFKKVNDAGGVHGRKLELVTLDDANQVARSGENTKKLVEEQGVFALVGYASATLSKPAMPTVEKYRVPFLAPFTGADPMRGFHKYVYNVRAGYSDELERIVEHYTTFGTKRFAIVHYEDAIGKENLAAVERALKKHNLTIAALGTLKDRAKPDIPRAVKEVMKGEPEVVIFTTLYSATSDFIKAAAKTGFTAQMVSNSFVGATSLSEALGDQGAGVAISQVVPPPTDRSVPVVREYQEAIEKLLGKKDFSFTSLEAFIDAKVLVEGLRRAGPKPTRESFMAALDSLDYDAGGFPVHFTPTNHNGGNFVEMTVIGANHRFNY